MQPKAVKSLESVAHLGGTQDRQLKRRLARSCLVPSAPKFKSRTILGTELLPGEDCGCARLTGDTDTFQLLLGVTSPPST